ncbi:hypothetical protein LTR56_010023 [Elasticomyces elasticus]|nr:hypothetical protein LTR56_010023 [Elasticomyces elasticus]KAK3665038.1 hypothetical protein LTR22_004093 [Elasticomyces elasticus]KAK4931586.1 hypothetical protein LTR49_001975 [Elasticomyces elasticus]KAK5766745.1 hypothetical protein LTS12_003095 [Elasticomyces elasticus]
MSTSSNAERYRKADIVGDKLRRHYKKEKVIYARYKADIFAYAEDNIDEAYRFLELCQHAHLISSSLVRVWDIISWFRFQEGDSSDVSYGIEELVSYHHKLAKLRLQLARLERNPERIPADEAYAASRDLVLDGSGMYGYEDELTDGGNGPEQWVPRYEGYKTVKYMLACFLVRKVYVENALPINRYPIKNYHTSVEYLMSMWICSAINGIRDEGLKGMDKLDGAYKEALVTVLRMMVEYRRALPGPDNEENPRHVLCGEYPKW